MSKCSPWGALVLVVVVVAFGCGQRERTTTAEAKNSLAGESFPFLFTADNFDAVRHEHDVQEGQSFLATGTLVFVRKGNVPLQNPRVLQTTLERAARAAKFKPMAPDQELKARPPTSERGWIEDIDTRVSTLVYDEPVQSKTEGGGIYTCRLWIAPDASHFAAWYSISY